MTTPILKSLLHDTPHTTTLLRYYMTTLLHDYVTTLLRDYVKTVA